MRQQYLALALLAILVPFAAACGVLNPQQPTPVPFDRYTAGDVFNAFARASLEIQNPQQNMTITGRGAPTGLSDRYTFEIPRIAPAGGQIIVFSSADQMQAWQTYIQTLSNNSQTHRDVIFVYFKANLMLQLNANLTDQEAAAYQNAFMSLN